MADCPRRIILPVNDGRLIAINAENGKLCETFANKGVLNLQSNMPDTKPGLPPFKLLRIITDKTIVIARFRSPITSQPANVWRRSVV